MKVGLTGGIGSGKSCAGDIFAGLGIPVYDSDSRGRELMNGGGALRRAVEELLGPEAYRNGRLNRAFVADRVFKDKLLLASLNGIVHPAVAQDFEAWAMSKDEYPYVILESAILFESGFDRFTDKVVTVSAPEEMRIERVASRDGVSRQSVMDRIANQLTDSERESRADFVVRNCGTIGNLDARVREIDKLLRQ